MMKKSDFYYDLPEALIAQTPAEKRDMSRLMVINRKTDQIEDRHFHDIVAYLKPGGPFGDERHEGDAGAHLRPLKGNRGQG